LATRASAVFTFSSAADALAPKRTRSFNHICFSTAAASASRSIVTTRARNRSLSASASRRASSSARLGIATAHLDELSRTLSLNRTAASDRLPGDITVIRSALGGVMDAFPSLSSPSVAAASNRNARASPPFDMCVDRNVPTRTGVRTFSSSISFTIVSSPSIGRRRLALAANRRALALARASLISHRPLASRASLDALASLALALALASTRSTRDDTLGVIGSSSSPASSSSPRARRFIAAA
tara:strand:- start:1678 stop:2406 length:729 start_codon:yes stop_codon:yes gene_type:complete